MRNFDSYNFDITKYEDAYELGITNHKTILFSKIKGIYVENFRTMKDKYLPLGDNITMLSGKNGTMKSTILGLIAHPFTSPNDAVDFFDNPLKTKLTDVFNLSVEKDTDKYKYYIHAETKDKEEFCEPVRVYLSSDKDRHRIVVGRDNTMGKGNFFLNTSYLNLKRLVPIVDTKAKRKTYIIPDQYKDFISSSYFKVLQNQNFKEIETIEDPKLKNTFGPTNSYYNYESISSGEDNLGFIFNKLCAFNKFKSNDPDVLQGILCIDEFEAGLHPIAQEKLLTLLLKWSKENHVQIILTTHSLYLIQCGLELIKKYNDNSVIVNMISSQYVNNNNYNIIINPSYKLAYKELTYKEATPDRLFKPTLFLEDTVAINYLKKLIKSSNINASLNFLTGITIDKDNPGISKNGLLSLIKNANSYFKDAIFIFDPDVDQKSISELKDKGAKALILPSFYKLCIEKEIIKYIDSLPGDHHLFSVLNIEKNAVLATFGDFNIYPGKDSFKNIKASICKNWYNANKKIYNKALLEYRNSIHQTEQYKIFYTEFSNYVNAIFEDVSLPALFK